MTWPWDSASSFFRELGWELSTTHQGDESGFLADFLEFVVVAYRRVGEVLELVVGVPVRAGVVEADLDVVFAASINVAFDEVAAVHFLASIPRCRAGWARGSSRRDGGW